MIKCFKGKKVIKGPFSTAFILFKQPDPLFNASGNSLRQSNLILQGIKALKSVWKRRRS